MFYRFSFLFVCWRDGPDWSDAPGVILFLCQRLFCTCCRHSLTCSLPMQSDMFTRNVRRRIEDGERSRIICAALRAEIHGLDVTDGLAVRFLSAELRGDREIGLAAVRRSSFACQYLTEALRADKEFGLAAVTANGCAVEFLSSELRRDRDIGLASLRSSSACQYVSALDGLVICAVEFLSEELRGDREIGLAAVRRTSYACQYLTAALRADRGFGLAAVTENGCAVEFLSAELMGRQGHRSRSLEK